MEITKSLRLPFQFDEQKLVHDLSQVLQNNWIPHFNTAGYDGNWKAVSLYGIAGEATNIFAFANEDSEIKETPILKDCLYFKEILNSFKFPILSARILKLEAGAEIKPHRDYKLGYEDNNFRLHIPITTNNKVAFILNEKLIKMLPGECWYTNVNYIHSVSNKGTTDRVHLVIDGKRNEWTDALFFSLAPKESFTPKPTQESPATIKRMIEELQQSNLEIAPELIKSLQKE